MYAMARNALVVGANGGVGKAVAAALLARGYAVTATVSRPEKLEAFRKEMPGCSRTLALDLADGDDVLATLRDVIADMAQLDAVVVCGAVAPFAPAEMAPLEIFRRTMEINCVSNLAIYQAAMPALRRSKGRLILTSSWSGRVATPIMAPYVSSKFALEGLTDVIRQEAGEWGVEVVLLQPGAIDTPMIRSSRDALAAAIAVLPQEEKTLYGKLYLQMKYRTDAALEAGGITPPEVVAAAAIHAIETDKPQPRYPVGADAELMVEASRTKSDREVDALILDIYRSSPIDPDIWKQEEG